MEIDREWPPAERELPVSLIYCSHRRAFEEQCPQCVEEAQQREEQRLLILSHP